MRHGPAHFVFSHGYPRIFMWPEQPAPGEPSPSPAISGPQAPTHANGSTPWQHLGMNRISKEARDLTFRIVVENATWGAPRIHGELHRRQLQSAFANSHRGRSAFRRDDRHRASEIAERHAFQQRTFPCTALELRVRGSSKNLRLMVVRPKNRSGTWPASTLAHVNT